MIINRVFFNGDCYLKLKASFAPAVGKKLILWTPEYLDHLFQPFLNGKQPVPLAVESREGEIKRLVNARITFRAPEMVDMGYQMEVDYDNLETASEKDMPNCHIDSKK